MVVWEVLGEDNENHFQEDFEVAGRRLVDTNPERSRYWGASQDARDFYSPYLAGSLESAGDNCLLASFDQEATY